MKLRNLDVVPQGAYRFPTPVAMPAIPNTDFLFGVGRVSQNAGRITAPESFGKSNGPDKQKDERSNNTVEQSSYKTCLSNTRNDRQCKDCCDCVGGDASIRKACRDACPQYDFSQNTEFKEFYIPSKLGPDGDYSACISSRDQQECKRCCDSSTQYACGDFQYCRKACAKLADRQK